MIENRLIPFHAKLDEVEPLITTARSVIHVGIGDSVIEALWSMKFFEELAFTDINESKLEILAGFLKENFPKIDLRLDVKPAQSKIELNRALKILTDIRKSLGLRPLSSGFRAREIKVKRLDIFDLEGFHDRESYDYVLFFGFTTVFKEALDEGYPISQLIFNVLRLMNPSGKAIFSDLLPKVDVIPLLREFGVKKGGLYTFYFEQEEDKKQPFDLLIY